MGSTFLSWIHGVCVEHCGHLASPDTFHLTVRSELVSPVVRLLLQIATWWYDWSPKHILRQLWGAGGVCSHIIETLEKVRSPCQMACSLPDFPMCMVLLGVLQDGTACHLRVRSANHRYIRLPLATCQP